MKIVSGLEHFKKLENIVKECYLKAQENKNETFIFIAEDSHVIEELFFKHTHYLFNIEIMSWNQFLKQVIIQQHLTHHHVLNDTELFYYIYHILKTESFFCFHNQPSFSLIKELASLMKDYDLYSIYYQTNILDSEKLNDYIKLYQCLKDLCGTNKHLCTEDIVNEKIQIKHQHFYIESDHLYDTKKQEIINQLDIYNEVTLLYTYNHDKRLLNTPYHSLCQEVSDNEYPSFLTDNLFMQNPSQCHEDMNYYTFIASSPNQEVKRVIYTIYQKIVDENLKYEDFVIVYPDSTYVDLLINTLSALHIPHNLPIVSSCLYDESYRKIMNSLDSRELSTFKDIACDLYELDIDSTYKNYLETLFEYDEVISKQEFKDFFIETYKNHHQEINNNQDHIEVCTIDKLKLSRPKHIFILGMNETVLPHVFKDTSLLLDNDIKQLRKHQYTTPLTSLEKLGVHHNDILKALCQPYITMTFSYATQTLAQNTLLPSSLYKQLQSMFNLLPLKINNYIPLDDYYTQGGLIDEKQILNQNIYNYKETKNQVRPITKETLQALYSSTLSISQIETYNKCPFQYFIQYGLGIYPLKEQQLTPSELGSLVHYVLSVQIDQQNNTSTLIDNYIKNDEALSSKISSSWINHYFIEQLKQDLTITIDILRKNLESSSFKVLSKEQKVEDIIQTMNFKGFVDRIDTYQNYVNIIDYKSSSKDIDLNLAMQGFNIQMLVYLEMVTKQYQKDPGAILYFNTKKRILSLDTHLSEPFDENLLLKQYMYGGYVIDDGSHNIIHAIDPTMESKSSIINVKYVKSKDDYTGHILSPIELKHLLEEIEKHIYLLYTQMIEGHISITPKGSDQSATHTQVNPCRYCPYHSVCGFDVFYNDYTLVEFLDVDKKLGGQEDAI